MVLAGLAFAGNRYYGWCSEASGPKDPVAFQVRKGAGGSEVVAISTTGGPPVRPGLEVALRRSGIEDRFRAGSFELTTNMTPDEAFEVLTTPPEPVPTRPAHDPRGIPADPDRRSRRGGAGDPGEAVPEAAEEGAGLCPPYLPEDATSIEGFLFPETYFVREDADADSSSAAARPVRHRGRVVRLGQRGGARVTPYEVVIIASMIEREAALDRERPIIAGVIYNRLKIGMTLGIDATLLYDDPTPDGQLSFSDLEYDSPYNTRINAGLPPTPIASPGRASLEAALQPGGHAIPLLCVVRRGRAPRVRETIAEHEANRVAAVSDVPDRPGRVRGSTRTVGVIGWPVEHSLSPAIHNAAFVALGLDWVYVPLPVAPARAPGRARRARRARLRRRERHDAAQDAAPPS